MKKAIAYRGAKTWNNLSVAGKIRNLMLIVIVHPLISQFVNDVVLSLITEEQNALLFCTESLSQYFCLKYFSIFT